jgi:predicted kinase
MLETAVGRNRWHGFGYAWKDGDDGSAVVVHVVYLVGGAPRTGKSSLARRLLHADGIAWLPTDVIRTVLRRVLPDLDALDQDPVDAGLLADYMYPHIRQAAEVCAEEPRGS